MAGFEVIVRPVVFPDIRPARARVLAPEDDPQQGIAVIGGGGGGTLTTSLNWSVSVSHQVQKETERKLDKKRVYQKDAKGNIDKNNFVDFEHMKSVQMRTPQGPLSITYAEPPPADNVETIQSNVRRQATENVSE